MIWYIAAHSLARTARRFCRDLWTPEKEANGVPIATLRPLIDLLSVWRDEHLSKVGVPSVWPATWDFVAAVTACESNLPIWLAKGIVELMRSITLSVRRLGLELSCVCHRTFAC